MPSRIFLPEADVPRYDGYGLAVDVENNYMVAGAAGNDTLQADAGLAYVYKLGADDKWIKIAELFASDAARSNRFGSSVSISGNSIAVRANEYRDDGSAIPKIYIFEKPAAGDWTSSSESYIITTSGGAQYNGFGQFHLHGNELIAIASADAQTRIKIYVKTGGVFSLSQSIDIPLNFHGRNDMDWKLAVSDDFFAIGNEQFYDTDGRTGVVFVYERSMGQYSTTPAVMKSSLEPASQWQGFGIGLTIHNSTLIVAGLDQYQTPPLQTLYIFERPATGWADAAGAPVLQYSGGYVYSQVQIAANDDYILIRRPDLRAVVGYKKTSGAWSSAAQYFEIADLTEGLYAVGHRIILSGQHLIVASPAPSTTRGYGDEMIADYYSSSGAWEDPTLQYNQLIREVSVNASDDLFGIGMAAHNNFLAVTASGDDDMGVNAGVVYIYDIASGNDEPLQKVYGPEAASYAGFGNSLALGDSVMFIAAPFQDSIGADQVRKFSGIGKVYVYRLGSGGWKYHSQIIAPNIHSQTYFGQNVVCSPGYVAVTEFYTGSSESVGLVHVYKENAAGKFLYLATMKPSTQLRSDGFGRSMVMNDSMMVIGTGNGAVNSSYRMRVYVYMKKGEWQSVTEDASLINSDAGWSDRFGHSVAVSGDYIVVGAPRSPGFDPRPVPRNYIIPGAAYIFQRPAGGWKGSNIQEIAKLSPSDPIELGFFGYRVVADHDDIFVSSPFAVDMSNYSMYFTNHDNTLRPGKVYHFKKPAAGWATTSQESRQLMSFEPEVVDGYGYELFISDRYLYVSSLHDDTRSGFRSGSVQTMMQLPVIDPIRVSCSDENAVELAAFPARGGAWSGPGINSDARTFNAGIAGPGLHTLVYTVSGCSETTTAEVVVSELEVFERSDAVVTKCIDGLAPLAFRTNEALQNYKWYFRDSEVADYTEIESLVNEIEAERTGYYKVAIDRTTCPDRTEIFAVKDEAAVDINIGAVDPVCADAEMMLLVEPSSGTWSGHGISPAGLVNTATLQDGTYVMRYVYATPGGCIWKDSTTVIIDRLKEPILTKASHVVCGNTPVALSLSNVDSRSAITWYNNDADIQVGTGVSLLVGDPGSYSASVSKHECSFVTPVVTLTAQVDSLFVPNIVTANGDFRNDFFEVQAEGLGEFHLSVMNRYGARVFETTSPTFRWSAENVSPGIYYWRAAYKTCSAESKYAKGWVQVMK